MHNINDNKLLNLYIKKFSLNKFLNKNLMQGCTLCQFNKGEKLSILNTNLNSLYFLVNGKAKVYTLLSNGKSLLLNFITPLSIIGDIEFVENLPADCFIEALEICTCISIPFNIIKKHGENDFVFLKFIISSLSKKLRINSIYSSINMLYPLKNRFASYLLSLPNGKDNIVEIESIQHVSELLGTSYRHLNRIIKELTDNNIIIKKSNKIELINLDLLNNLAKDIYK